MPPKLRRRVAAAAVMKARSTSAPATRSIRGSEEGAGPSRAQEVTAFRVGGLDAPSSPEYSGGSSGEEPQAGGAGELRRVLEVSRAEAAREGEQLQEALRRSVVEGSRDTGEVERERCGETATSPTEEVSPEQVSDLCTGCFF